MHLFCDILCFLVYMWMCVGVWDHGLFGFCDQVRDCVCVF